MLCTQPSLPIFGFSKIDKTLPNKTMPDLWVSYPQDTLGDSDSTESFPEVPWGPEETEMVERFANDCYLWPPK